MTIAEIEDEIVDEFSFFNEWQDKYEYIIDLGKKLKGLHADQMVDDNKVKGCQSSVWLISSEEDGRVFFDADSDSTIVKGLIALLIRVLSGQHADDIVNAELSFIDKLGLRRHLAQTRSNGLAAMIKQMKLYALGYKLKQEQKA